MLVSAVAASGAAFGGSALVIERSCGLPPLLQYLQFWAALCNGLARNHRLLDDVRIQEIVRQIVDFTIFCFWRQAFDSPRGCPEAHGAASPQ